MHTRFRRVVVAAIAAAIPLSFLVAFGGSGPASATTSVVAQHIVMPFYAPPDSAAGYAESPQVTYPTLDVQSPWDKLHAITSFGANGDVAIANPASGPDYAVNQGPVADLDYADTLGRATADGVRVIGYVDTGYLGTTSLPTRLGSTSMTDWVDQIEQDVNAWYGFYGAVGGAAGDDVTTDFPDGTNAMAGIFLDESTNQCGTSDAYSDAYQQITQYIHDTYPGSFVVLNAGTAVPLCYENSADTLVTYEGSEATYVSEFQNNTSPFGDSCFNSSALAEPSGDYQYCWQLNWTPVDPNKIMHIVYGVCQVTSCSADLTSVMAESKSAGAGYVFLTDQGALGTAPHYNDLPGNAYGDTDSTFFTDEIADAVGSGGESVTEPDTVDTYDVQYTTAQLNWGASTDCGGSAVVGYDTYLKNDTTDTGYLWAGSTPIADYTAPDIYLTGLIAGDEYSAKVYARTLDGSISEPGSYTWWQETDHDLEYNSTPGTPSRNGDFSADYTSEHLVWTASSGGSDSILWYYLFEGGTLIERLPGDQASATVIGLSPNTSYTYTVQAEDTAGNMTSVSSGGSLTTKALPSPGYVEQNITGSYTSSSGDLTVTANIYEPFSFIRLYVDSNYENESSAGAGFAANAFQPFFAGDPQAYYGAAPTAVSMGDSGNSSPGYAWTADFVAENNTLYTASVFNGGGESMSELGTAGDFAVSGLGTTTVTWTIPAPTYGWSGTVHVDVETEGFNQPTNGGAVITES